MVIYCDIDGTLTTDPIKYGSPREDTIAKLKDLIQNGHRIVLWSAGGSKYAKDFAKKHGIKASSCLRKPDIMVDDKKTIRTKGIPIISPDEFLKMEISEKNSLKKDLHSV